MMDINSNLVTEAQTHTLVLLFIYCLFSFAFAFCFSFLFGCCFFQWTTLVTSKETFLRLAPWIKKKLLLRSITV